MLLRLLARLLRLLASVVPARVVLLLLASVVPACHVVTPLPATSCTLLLAMFVHQALDLTGDVLRDVDERAAFGGRGKPKTRTLFPLSPSASSFSPSLRGGGREVFPSSKPAP